MLGAKRQCPQPSLPGTGRLIPTGIQGGGGRRVPQVSHQDTKLGQDRSWSPSLLEAIGVRSPSKLW